MTTNSPRRRASEPPQDAPICHDKRMVLRFGPCGAFYGCHAYPDCKRTLPANVREPDWFNRKGAGK